MVFGKLPHTSYVNQEEHHRKRTYWEEHAMFVTRFLFGMADRETH